MKKKSSLTRWQILLREPQILLRLALIMVSLAVGIFAFSAFSRQRVTLAKLKKEYAIAQRIPALEQELNSPEFRSRREADRRDAQARSLKLDGLSVRGGVNYAVIDGNVYKEGDAVGDFTLRTVNPKFIILEDPALNETRTLYFRGEEKL